ncbi:MAG: T9SS type A sorting domain-containing protein [Bacteroidales bacterium]|nr:T9SS type A sorting domain-containing protein [Bacteroidales bacterium]
MKLLKILTVALFMTVPTAVTMAQADTIDVLDYDLTLDLSGGAPFAGKTVLTMQKLSACETIGLDFIGTVDSIRVSGREGLSYEIDSIVLPQVGVGEPFTVTVWYHGNGYVESYGWGGFHFNTDMSYNLGVAFDEDPHSVGRAMFPCRDNFTDKATYTIRMKTQSGWTAECGGICQSREVNADGTESSVWRIAQQTPVYLVSVSQAAWNRMERNIQSEYGTYPLSVGFTTQTRSNVELAFDELDSVVPMYERSFGPYRWGRIGYIATRQGSMESVNNIALDRRFVASMSEPAQTTIAHELGHAWFGNLVTCSSEGDMWFNEGGASFTSEVAMEAVKGRVASDDYYQRYLENVIRSNHITDNGYFALHGMPHNITYGSTTYEKGWMMWHYLRGYLGEEVFYDALARLMQNKAFGNVDAYAVRDSLSLYSGVDLTDFFDFHVFNPGFVDYHVEMMRGGCIESEVVVTIRQQGVGTNATMQSNRVPVTFFAEGDGWDSTSCKRWFEFDGEICQESVHLPFVPAFCVLDLDREISDAATNGEMVFRGMVQRSADVAHMRIKAKQAQPDSVTVYVEHHWGKPYNVASMEGVSSSIDRYWVVNTTAPLYGVQGMFQFVSNNYGGGSYPYLDGSRLMPGSLDSAVVLYRPAADQPWRAVSRERLDNNQESFFVVNNIQAGEYTIAMVDSNIVGIESPAQPAAAATQLFPNPLRRGDALTIEVAVEGPFSVAIYDNAGRLVWNQDGVVSGQKLQPKLTAGTYTVLIDNHDISLQSRLIQL